MDWSTISEFMILVLCSLSWSLSFLEPEQNILNRLMTVINCILTLRCRDKGFHAFLKGISPKVNLMTRLEFETTYFEIAILHVSHDTPLNNLVYQKFWWPETQFGCSGCFGRGCEYHNEPHWTEMPSLPVIFSVLPPRYASMILTPVSESTIFTRVWLIWPRLWI